MQTYKLILNCWQNKKTRDIVRENSLVHKDPLKIKDQITKLASLGRRVSFLLYDILFSYVKYRGARKAR